MITILLQSKVVETTSKVILDYGALGAMLVLCIAALIYMIRFFIREFEKMRREYTTLIDSLRSQLGNYIESDRVKMILVIEKNTEAMLLQTKVIEELKNEIKYLRNDG